MAMDGRFASPAVTVEANTIIAAVREWTIRMKPRLALGRRGPGVTHFPSSAIVKGRHHQ